MKTLRKRTIWILLTLFLLPLLAFGFWYGRQVRQHRLDYALIEAIKKQDTQKAISLLDQGANANAVDKPDKPQTFMSNLLEFWRRIRGQAPAKDAAHYPSALSLVYVVAMDKDRDHVPENVPLIRALLEHGAQPDTSANDGVNVLEMAVICDHVAVVRLMLEHKANPNCDNIFGGPLMEANYESTRLLLEHGAEVEVRDMNEYTPLLSACQEKDVRRVRLLLEYGANPSVRAHNGQTTMEAAAEAETPDLFQALLDHGAKVNMTIGYRYNHTALIHVARFSPSADKVRILLRHGAKVALKDSEGYTVLDYARQQKEKTIISLLIVALKKEQAKEARR